MFPYYSALQNGTFKQQQKKALKIQRGEFSLPCQHLDFAKLIPLLMCVMVIVNDQHLI